MTIKSITSNEITDGKVSGIINTAVIKTIEHTVTLTDETIGETRYSYSFDDITTDNNDYWGEPSFSNGVNYDSTTEELVIPAGVETFTIEIMVNSDLEVEGDETYKITLGGEEATGTILNDDRTPEPTPEPINAKVSISQDAESINEGESNQYTVTLNKAVGQDTKVYIEVSSGDETTNYEVIIKEGETQESFTLDTEIDTNQINGNFNIKIVKTDNTDITINQDNQDVTTTIIDTTPAPTNVKVSILQDTESINEGEANQYTLKLDHVATEDTVVYIEVSTGDETSKYKVTIKQGETQQSFTLDTEVDEDTIDDSLNIKILETDKVNITVDQDAKEVTTTIIDTTEDKVNCTTSDPTYGTTGTYLDEITDKVMNDEGIQRQVVNGQISSDDITEAVKVMNRMNEIINEGMEETGISKDGHISSGDVIVLNEYIRDNYLDEWSSLHGDDDGTATAACCGRPATSSGDESGFHNVVNDGGTGKMFGQNFVNTVADGIYHLGYEIQNGRILNEDGNANAKVEDLAGWLNFFIKDRSTTGTGLDQIIDIIENDNGLNVTGEDMSTAMDSANKMNAIIVKAIEATGAGKDNYITTDEIKQMNSYIRSNHQSEWDSLHGDDDGGTTNMFGTNFINNVADSIYHMGYEIKGNNFLNEDGNQNAAVSDVAGWINYFYADQSTTGTGLDCLVDMMKQDAGLLQNTSASDVSDGLISANAMNAIIDEAIVKQGLAKDGHISVDDVYEINSYIREHYESKWASLHGDDDGNATTTTCCGRTTTTGGGTETGFHKIVNDGSTDTHYGDNLVNTVADGIYHLGYEIQNGHVLNEDGNANASVSDLAQWLNQFYVERSDTSLIDLTNKATPEVCTDDETHFGTTGSILDNITDKIATDTGLKNVSDTHMEEAIDAMNGMNTIILEAIEKTGVNEDGKITAGDVVKLNQYIIAHHQSEWASLHGDDSNGTTTTTPGCCGRKTTTSNADGSETGFHTVVNDGATDKMFGQNFVNTVMDGIYHLGFELEGTTLDNEDGNKNADVQDVAGWLNYLLNFRT